MLFSKLNFIAPINTGDIVLRLKNTSGAIVYIIKEATCTIKQNGKFLVIKQSAESLLINLEFSSSAEATDAHSLLRDALDTILENQNPSPIPPTPGTGGFIVSKDFKIESPTSPTTMNGEKIQGISQISNTVEGGNFIAVEVNGIDVVVGNGTDSANFSTPNYHLLFAKEFTSFTTSGSSITILSPICDFVAGDSVIINDNGTIVCLDVITVSLNVITLSGAITGPVTFVARPKRWNKIAKGDIPLWFGSIATYELDTDDTIVYKYLVKP